MEDQFAVALEDYPPDKVSWTLCKLSIDGKAYITPTDLKPKSPWVWRFKPSLREAIFTLLLLSEIRFTNV